MLKEEEGRGLDTIRGDVREYARMIYILKVQGEKMQQFIVLIVGVVVIGIVFFIANFIATLDTKWNDFSKDDFFDFKHGSRLSFLMADGLSEKEAYEKIIVEQDEQLLEKYRLILFWAILTIVAIPIAGAGLL